MLTNKDLVLNELEHTWNEIDKEIKRVADNDYSGLIVKTQKIHFLMNLSV